MTGDMAKAESKPSSTGKCGRPPNSAYMALMKEDEDWTQLEDATERRKIQNRLAQRAYRRNLQKRNKEVEALKEQLTKLQEAGRQNTYETNIKDTRISNTKQTGVSGKFNNRSSPNASFSRPGSTQERSQSSFSSDATPSSSGWIASSHEEISRSQSLERCSMCGSVNPQFFDRHPNLDFDHSPSFISVSSPGGHPNQSEATDLDIQIIDDDLTRLCPFPPAHDAPFIYERDCNRPGEDSELFTRPFHPNNFYESTMPLQLSSPPRCATPNELSRLVSLGTGEEKDYLGVGYPSPLVSMSPSITDFPAATPGTHSRGQPQHDITNAANVNPASYGASPSLVDPGSRQPIWAELNSCSVLSLLHMTVSCGHVETIRLVLDHRPGLAHAVGSDGYTAVQRAIMFGRDDVLGLFIQ